MAILSIHSDKSEYLHKKAADVTFPLDLANKRLISDMKSTLLAKCSALGLAAPQVGAAVAVLTYRCSEKQQPIVMINPSIIKATDYSRPKMEMCLSYPNEIYEVSRATRIAVRFFDENGDHYVLKFRGQEAVIIQHEVDHLLGFTIKDRGAKVPSMLANEILGISTDDDALENREDDFDD